MPDPVRFDIVTSSRKALFYFLAKCNEYYRSGHDLTHYREIIARHRKATGLAELIDDPAFLRLLYETLELWNMNQKGARLTTLDRFRASLREHKDELRELYPYKLLTLQFTDFQTITPLLESVFCGLEGMKSRRRIVGVSKALHFLLPDLVMPIDGKFTLPGFYGCNVYQKTALAEFQEQYRDILFRSYQAVRRLNLTEADIDGKGWNTTAPKLIGNALIGLYKYFDHYTAEEFNELLLQLQD